MIRTLAGLAAAGPIVFTGSWLVAAHFQPGCSHVDHYVSDLAVPSAPHRRVAAAGTAVAGA